MHEITENYKADKTRFEDFTVKAEVLIKELLVQHSINYHKIESRTKDPIKLDEKIIRKNDKYKTLNEVTDLVGIRIIAYFEDEVDKIASIIDSEFVVDGNNTIDKRKLEADRFGYKSLHYVVSLSEQRKELTEYKRFKDIMIEIQIRSILQHAWAEIEHDIGYKGEYAVPDSVKRDFFRVAALLETADIEFVNIKNKLLKYEETVLENIKLHPEEVEINGSSVLSFINNDEVVYQLDKEMAKLWHQDLGDSNSQSALLIANMLQYLHIKTVKELEASLKENKDLIVPFMDKWTGNKITGKILRGFSVFYLCYIIVAKRNDPTFSQGYYANFFPGNTKHVGHDINDIYNQITETSTK